MALTLTSQAEFTALLAKEAEDKELVFFIHGFNVQDKGMVTSTDNMQTNFDSSPQKQKDVLVVPVDCMGMYRPLVQKSAARRKDL